MQYVCIRHFLYFSVQTFTNRTPRWNRSMSEFQRAPSGALRYIFSRNEAKLFVLRRLYHDLPAKRRRCARKSKPSVFRRSPPRPEGYSSRRDRFIARKQGINPISPISPISPYCPMSESEKKTCQSTTQTISC